MIAPTYDLEHSTEKKMGDYLFAVGIILAPGNQNCDKQMLYGIG